MATPHAFDVAAFRGLFLEFSDSTLYPDLQLSGYWTVSANYLSLYDGAILSGDSLQYALNLMTAHIAKSFSMLNAGQTSVVVQGSSTGSVSVSLVPPPVQNAYQFWLSTTGYGAQLRALLAMKATSIQYIGGGLERASFRKAGGVW